MFAVTEDAAAGIVDSSWKSLVLNASRHSSGGAVEGGGALPGGGRGAAGLSILGLVLLTPGDMVVGTFILYAHAGCVWARNL